MNTALQQLYLLILIHFSSFHPQSSDTVSWASGRQERHLACQKVGCWFVGGNDFTEAPSPLAQTSCAQWLLSSPRGRPSASPIRSDVAVVSHAQSVLTLTLKVVSELRVTWATCVPILVFLGLSILELGPMYDSVRRQTSDRHQTKASLNAPPIRCGA